MTEFCRVPQRASWALFIVLLVASISIVSGEELCQICECKGTYNDFHINTITCQTTNRGLFEDDVEWPKGVKRINLIEFKDMLSSVLPIFKCDKEVGEIKFERSDLRGIDKKSLSYLPNVQKFSFAYNQIEKLSPDNFQRTEKVTELNFMRNKLEDIPSGLFAELKSLSVIDLSFNRFQIFSDKLIENLKKISVVSLRKNNIYAIDQVDSKDILIEELDLSGNNLRFLKSKQFKSFANLKHLNLSYNSIKDIQDDAFLEVDSLITLDLSNNQLLSIDLILPNLITTFIIRNNVLAVWPIKEINAALSTVDLHNNTLEIIHIRGPEHILIKHLILSDNQLESLPNRNFTELKHLDLSFNKFEKVPGQLGSIAPKLERLEMSGNPIEFIQFESPITLSQLTFKNMPKLKGIAKNSFENVTGRSSSLESEPLLDLEISYCPLLTTIEEDAFEGINFYNLDLSYNHISHFPQQLTNWSIISGVLNLQGNNISCDCADEWIITEILNKLYEDSRTQYLLEDLRCGGPEPRKDVRLVRFYRHVAPFCGNVRPEQMRSYIPEKKEDPLMSGFHLNSLSSNRRGPSPWLVVGVCAFTLICLVVVGIILQRDVNRRRKESRRKMLFSDL